MLYSLLIGTAIGLVFAFGFICLGRYVEARQADRRDSRLARRTPMNAQAVIDLYYASSKVPLQDVLNVREIIATHANIKGGELLYPSDRLSDLSPVGFDDMGMWDIIADLIDLIGYRPPDGEWDLLDTIDEMIRYVSFRKASQGSPFIECSYFKRRFGRSRLRIKMERALADAGYPRPGNLDTQQHN